MSQAANLLLASRPRSAREPLDAEPASDAHSLSAHLAGAIDASCSAILRTQHDDGSWSAPADSGPASTALVLVTLHHLGALDPALARSAVKWLRAQQRDDGSFVRFPTAAEGDLDATAHAWAALHLFEDDATRRSSARARLFVQEHGGTRAISAGLDRGDLGAISLALVDLLPARGLQVPPLLPLLVPGAESWLLERFHAGVLMNLYAVGAVVRRLRGDWGQAGNPPGALDSRTCRRATALLETFQNDDGSWNGWTIPTALGAVALHALGLPRDHERITRATRWLAGQALTHDSGCWFPAFQLPMWSTTFDARALLSARPSGTPEPAVLRSIEWLLKAQAEHQSPINNRRPGAVLAGGFPFTPGNSNMPDCDDTAAALSVLGMTRTALRAANGGETLLERRINAATDRAEKWLLGMQNDDGGWPAYVRGLPSKRSGAIMTEVAHVPRTPLALLALLRDPPPALGDPSTEDVTGRVLHGLGALGHTAGLPHVQRAVAFLKRMQCPNGAFWGRWLTNFLSGTAFAISGLAAIHENLEDEWVQRAIGWLLTRQRADGAWGETVASYRDPTLAGVGPASPPLTGLVVTALIDAGLSDTPAVVSAVRYLLEAQSWDGTWADADHLAPLVPPDTFYAYREAAQYYPLEALGRFRSSGRR